jgi:hypothetical protein
VLPLLDSDREAGACSPDHHSESEPSHERDIPLRHLAVFAHKRGISATPSGSATDHAASWKIMNRVHSRQSTWFDSLHQSRALPPSRKPDHEVHQKKIQNRDDRSQKRGAWKIHRVQDCRGHEPDQGEYRSTSRRTAATHSAS